jgi:phytanoyl-CoA hydroxylase
MPYPDASPAQVAAFAEHGFLVVRGALPRGELDEIERHCDLLLDDKPRYAKDWAWAEGEALGQRSFRIVQSSLGKVWPRIEAQAFRHWVVRFGSALMGMPMEFWYDQFLGKPPGASAPTRWHQDEGYWGGNLRDKGITGWIPLQDVEVIDGCMQFIDRGHRDGILAHRRVPGVQSDLLECDVDESRTVACPMARGDVVFHHSKTPHMSGANEGTRWRKAVTNHLQAVGAGGEGDPYPWRVKVAQR